MRARGLPPDAPARRHVRTVVLAIACTCFALPSGRVQYVCMSMCVQGSMGVCMQVYACVRMCYCVFPYPLASPPLASPRLAPHPLPFLPLSSVESSPLLAPPASSLLP